MSKAEQRNQFSLGIDLGTQSVKVVVLNIHNGEICFTFSESLPITQTDDGLAEQNSSDWLRATTLAIQAIPAELKEGIAAIAVSGQQHGFVPIDVNGKVLAPVKLWCDTTTQSQCDEIMHTIGGKDACIKLAGNPVLVGYTASKILAFKQAKPELYAQMAAVLLPHDYLNYWLTGEFCMEMGDASGTGLFNTKTRTWSEAIINAIDDSGHLQTCLPKLVNHQNSIGGLTEKIASLTGLKVATPVACGGGDNMMAAIGTGAVTQDQITISLGTSGTLFAYSEKPIIDPNGGIASFCSSNGGWLPLLCTMACTTTTELYRTLLGVPLNELDGHLADTEIGAQGLVTLPFFNGERVPNLPNGKGVLMGMTANNLSTGNVLRSGIEGVTFGLYNGFLEMQKLGLKNSELVVTGGGANSAAWRQMLADVFNHPVTLLANNEGAAMGAAIQAASLINNSGRVDKQYTDLFLKPESGIKVLPNADAHSRYKTAFTEFRRAQTHVQAFYSER